MYSHTSATVIGLLCCSACFADDCCTRIIGLLCCSACFAALLAARDKSVFLVVVT